MISTVKRSKNNETAHELIQNFMFSAPIHHINKYNTIRAIVKRVSTQRNQTHTIHRPTPTNIKEISFYFHKSLEYE